MGRFPNFEETGAGGTGNLVQLVDTQQARMAGENLQALGEASQKLAEVISNKEAEKAGADAEIALVEAHTEATKTASKDGKDFGDRFSEAYNKRLNTITSKLDPLAAGKFAPTKQMLDTRMRKESVVTGFNMKVKHYSDISQEQRVANASIIQNNPDEAAILLKKARNSSSADKVAGMVEEVVDNEYDKTGSMYASAFVSGMMLKGRGDVQYLHRLKKYLGSSENQVNVPIRPDEMQALGLKSDGTQLVGYTSQGHVLNKDISEVLRKVTPEQRAHYLAQIDSIFATHTKTKLKHINNVLEEGKKKALKEGLLSQDVAQMVDVVNAAPPEVRPQLQSKLELIKNVNTIGEYVARGGMAAAMPYLKSLEPTDSDPLEIRTVKRKFADEVFTELKKIDVLRAEDPAEFLIQRDPEVADAFAATKDGSAESRTIYHDLLRIKQKEWGLQPSFASKGEGKSIHEVLVNSARVGPEALNMTLTQLQAQHGDDMGQVLSDVVRYVPEADPAIALLGTLTRPESKQLVANNMANKKKIYEDLDKIESGKRDLFIELKSINDKMIDMFYAGDPKANTYPALRAMSDAVQVEAARLMTDPAQRLDAADATKQAYKSIVESNYSVFSTGKSNILLPASVDMDKFKTFVFEQATKPQGQVPELPPVIPNLKGEKPVPKGGAWTFENTSLYVGDKAVTAYDHEYFYSHAKLVTTPDQLGVQLMWDSGNGLRVIKDRDGKPMVKSFEEINRYSGNGNYYKAVEQARPKVKAFTPTAPSADSYVPEDKEEATEDDTAPELDEEEDSYDTHKPAEALKYFQPSTAPQMDSTTEAATDAEIGKRVERNNNKKNKGKK